MNPWSEKTFEGFENDLSLHYCGKRIHNMSHSFGPYDRDAYLLYYIREGEALLQNNGTAILLKGPGFFVNFPRSFTSYQCKEKIAWSIQWLEVAGPRIGQYLNLLGVTRENPFFPLYYPDPVKEILDELYERFDRDSLSSKLYCISLVHKLFAVLAEERNSLPPANPSIRTAQLLLQQHFSDPGWNVNTLAEQVGLQYNYFSILFKKVTGETPIHTLTRLRLENACKLLKYTNLPIHRVAEKSGFADELYFSRVFRKNIGLSPSSFRKKEEYLI